MSGRERTSSPPDSSVPSVPQAFSRRDFLSAVLLSPIVFTRQSADARFVSTVPIGNPANLPTAPLERLLGASLDARLFTDLASIDRVGAGSLITPNDRYYVRTAYPAPARGKSAWTIPFGGLADPFELTLGAIERGATPAGPYVMECAGNADPANFGLLSAATWSGLLLYDVLAEIRAPSQKFRVLISGVDDAGPAVTSIPGASWIFSVDDLQQARLAVGMNGAPLPPDHGAPVRLIVPGWYGCACIKWVDRIDLVPDDAPATTQMREFAVRTHQPFDSPEALSSLRAGPALAREFTPAVIDTAAMPVRLEKWINAGRVEYRVIGVMWGGAKATNALSIRFKTGGTWTKVDNCPLPASTQTWSTWTHTWRPSEIGRYQIVLRVDDTSIRTRRLDLFYYARDTFIDEV